MNQLYRNRKKYSKTQLKKKRLENEAIHIHYNRFLFYPISLTYNFKIDRGVKLNSL